MKAQEAVRNRIEELCKERGITLNKLATISGIRQSTLNDIMHGICKSAGIKTIEGVCDGLGISVYDFFNSEFFK